MCDLVGKETRWQADPWRNRFAFTVHEGHALDLLMPCGDVLSEQLAGRQV
jgi:hypothetical protein